MTTEPETDNTLALVEDADLADAADLIEQLAAMARTDEPEPLAAGTFVLYPMRDGGMMFVTSVDEGLMAGIKHTRVPPGLIRAIGVLVNGGSKLSALKAMTGFGIGGRRRKEVESGE